MGAAEIARTALLIAAEIDLYTSGTATVLTLGGEADATNAATEATANEPTADESDQP
jgi:ATP-dependent HslUV protease subunit HslV